MLEPGAIMNQPRRINRISLLLLFVTVGALLDATTRASQITSPHGLHFTALARQWDEAIPLGNGVVGALVWQKGTKLRFSLDRADLWDLRPVREFETPQFRFSWFFRKVLEGDYGSVQQLSDVPYERDPAPTKIPAGALEFELTGLGEVESVRLQLETALCEVKWRKGAHLLAFVHAARPVGWFRFDHLPSPVSPQIAPPLYNGFEEVPDERRNSVEGNDLRRLGYSDPKILRNGQSLQYVQQGWGGFRYEVEVRWDTPGPGSLMGAWGITTLQEDESNEDQPSALPMDDLMEAYAVDFETHQQWWRQYWRQSAISLPDPVLEAQWYRELYKFGATSRRGAPPISLQAVWTADNGRIPPWKGDYHHDLNTQLSYWPCYSSNHLEEGLAYLDWLWRIRPAALEFTRTFFEAAGLNVPGVTTLAGKPMGGWAQYSFSPTVSAWLAQHFYLHWRYSRDRVFLQERAYPWIKEVALFLDKIAVRGKDGFRRLPLSSSPEINDNRIDAWFQQTTNYDLALIRWLYCAAGELAEELGRREQAAEWRKILSEWPTLALSPQDRRLLVAPEVPLAKSHRHFSHLMAIHPLGLIDWANGLNDQQTIRASLSELDKLGPGEWCGYSYAWLGNLAARARDGDRAAKALRIFAECFCLPNSFHANGDQSGTGKSNFTYRPFTLEGNFAFAAGIQEMLLQSHSGVIHVFPAIPASWKDVSFDKLRTEGAFLVTAKKSSGNVREVTIMSEKGGPLRLANPFTSGHFTLSGASFPEQQKGKEVIEIETRPGMVLQFRRE
jgi:alpha-L-fucosidase 2